jgi:hypothetical protein
LAGTGGGGIDVSGAASSCDALEAFAASMPARPAQYETWIWEWQHA